MIDIHSHMIFNVDDGSQALNESLKLLKSASLENITDVICTPHYLQYGNYHITKNKMQKPFEELQKAVQAANIPINLYLGNEVMYQKNSIYNYIIEDKISTLANSNYVLFELPFNKFNPEIYEEIYDLKISGYQPILAHPERYPYVQAHPNLVYELVAKGCLIQVNQDSIMQKNGKKAYQTVMLLLEHHLVHFVASDGHNLKRPVTLIKSYQYLQTKITNQYLNELYYLNAQNILRNNPINIRNYSKISKSKGWKAIFSKMKKKNH